MWSILLKVHGYEDVYTVEAFSGMRKQPRSDSVLKNNVNELQDLMINELFFEGHTHTIECRSFICDAPAWSCIKGTYRIL